MTGKRPVRPARMTGRTTPEVNALHEVSSGTGSPIEVKCDTDYITDCKKNYINQERERESFAFKRQSV